MRLLLSRAADAKPHVRDEPATEAPSIHVTAPGIELRYVGFDVTPDLVKPLVNELDGLVGDHCRRANP